MNPSRSPRWATGATRIGAPSRPASSAGTHTASQALPDTWARAATPRSSGPRLSRGAERSGTDTAQLVDPVTTGPHLGRGERHRLAQRLGQLEQELVHRHRTRHPVGERAQRFLGRLPLAVDTEVGERLEAAADREREDPDDRRGDHRQREHRPLVALGQAAEPDDDQHVHPGDQDQHAGGDDRVDEDPADEGQRPLHGRGHQRHGCAHRREGDDQRDVLGPSGQPRQRPRRQPDSGGHQGCPAGPLEASPVAWGRPPATAHDHDRRDSGHHEAQDDQRRGRHRRGVGGEGHARPDGREIATDDEGQAASGQPAVGQPDGEVEHRGQGGGERERAPVTGTRTVRGLIRQRQRGSGEQGHQTHDTGERPRRSAHGEQDGTGGPRGDGERHQPRVASSDRRAADHGEHATSQPKHRTDESGHGPGPIRLSRNGHWRSLHFGHHGGHHITPF